MDPNQRRHLAVARRGGLVAARKLQGGAGRRRRGGAGRRHRGHTIRGWPRIGNSGWRAPGRRTAAQRHRIGDFTQRWAARPREHREPECDLGLGQALPCLGLLHAACAVSVAFFIPAATAAHRAPLEPAGRQAGRVGRLKASATFRPVFLSLASLGECRRGRGGGARSSREHSQ